MTQKKCKTPSCEKPAQPKCRQCRMCRKKPGEDKKYYPQRRALKERDRLAALEKYGGKQCVCCGESIVRFLTIDHVNNDGSGHRRVIGHSASQIYLWLRRNGYPPGFQTLCLNCNLGRHFNKGICPHKEIEMQKANAKETEWFTLVKTCRATGIIGKFTPNHPGYDEQHESIRAALEISAGELVGRLMETRNPNAPAVVTAGFLYRYEA